LPELENHPYFVVVTTEKDIDVDLAAKFARMSLDEFKSLNPSFNKPVILGASDPQILLPFGRAESFQENLRSFSGKLSSWTAIRLGNRETVDQLAKRLNVDASHIRDINNIPKGMAIKAGSTVIIPKNHRGKDVPDYLAENATISLEREGANKKKAVKGAKGKKGQSATGGARTTKAKTTKKAPKKEASKKDSAKHSG
jgi:membrane-bound lytic murein transglycosylase D